VERFGLATMLLLFLPTTPLLFMGQEWAATTPFLFFSDHEGACGAAVTKGRRKEFEGFAAFRSPEAAERIPDPQALETFHRSKLAWEEAAREPHARILALHRTMLRQRRDDPVLSAPCRWEQIDAWARGEVLHVVRRNGTSSRELVINFSDEPVRIETSDRDRTISIWGRLAEHRLGARSAVVFACD
jgi:maltooligosyltrehalose trehalohydrolase